MKIVEAKSVDTELVEAIARLVPQLSTGAPLPSPEDLAEIVASPSQLLLARDEAGTIVGTLTLTVFRIPTALRCRIEDVIVDQAARGRGIGEALMCAALERARALGAPTVDLTSNPKREAANRLYLRLGFEPRQTNIYRYEV